MKASSLKTERQIDISNNRQYRIQTYGVANDYPQRVQEIVEGSVTGNGCVKTYGKFIAGRGFAVRSFYEAAVNNEGKTADELLQALAEDYAMFAGFALHVNYNANYEIAEVTHVPFEWLRFDEMDADYGFNRVALHRDWGKRYTALRRFDADDIERYNLFDPSPATIEREVAEAGGWENYNGQILYFSNRGDKTYPRPTYVAALTDMSNEEGLSNITQRNVRHNFLPAGMLVDFDNEAESNGQMEDTKNELKQFQGDMKAGQLMYVNVRNGEQAPEFRAFTTNNYDKAFTAAEEKTPDIIGRAFSQPPILRGEDVGAGFGADLMENAYEFYNTITAPERQKMAQVFARVFALWHDRTINPEQDYDILPLAYRVNKSLAEKLGDNTDKILELLYDEGKSPASKRIVLEKIYGVEAEDIDELLNGMQA